MSLEIETQSNSKINIQKNISQNIENSINFKFFT